MNNTDTKEKTNCVTELFKKLDLVMAEGNQDQQHLDPGACVGVVKHTKYSVIEINVETDKDMPSEDVDDFIQEFLDDLKITTTLCSPKGAMHLTASVPYEEPTP